MFEFLKITDNTFKESLREPVYFLMLLCAVILIGHFPSMSLFVFSEQLKLVVDSSMATSLLFSLLCAVLCASHTISLEMRNGTVLLLLSKPISRRSFVLAKICGIVLASSLFALICNLSALVSVYIAVDQFRLDMTAYLSFLGVVALACAAGMLANFLRGSSFSATSTAALAVLVAFFAVYCAISREKPSLSMRDLCFALILINFSVVSMSTLAAVFAVHLDTVANLVFCSVFFFLGLVSGHLFGGDTGSDVVNFIFGILYAVLPNWQYMWMADAIATNRSIPASYLACAACYVVSYAAICAIWAVTLLQNKEIAGGFRQ